MEANKKEPILFIIGGKARSGKDTAATFLEEQIGKYHKKLLRVQYSTILKEYAKKICGWDGSEETKPRDFLQYLGTSIIREELDEYFFIKQLMKDIEVYSYFYEVFIISDARLIVEFEEPKKYYKRVVSISIVRNEAAAHLNTIQQKHITEVELDQYHNYDYVIENNGTLEELKEKIETIVNEEMNK